jgi:hypothetical protein
MIAAKVSVRRLEELEPAHRVLWAGSNTPIERAPSGAIAESSDDSFRSSQEAATRIRRDDPSQSFGNLYRWYVGFQPGRWLGIEPVRVYLRSPSREIVVRYRSTSLLAR